eukprot:1448754-Rhodomonas_salina.1
MLSLFDACRAHYDDLSRISAWEWVHSRGWIWCTTDEDAAQELTAQASRQLGVTVSWQQEGYVGSGQSHGPTITRASRHFSSDKKVYADSMANDAHLIQCSVNSALCVLLQHGLCDLFALLLPDSKWKPFWDLPQAVVCDSLWSGQDLSALQLAITRSGPFLDGQ